MTRIPAAKARQISNAVFLNSHSCPDILTEDRKDLVAASNKLSKAPLFVDDTPSRTVSEIAACGRRLKRKEGLGLGSRNGEPETSNHIRSNWDQ